MKRLFLPLILILLLSLLSITIVKAENIDCVPDSSGTNCDWIHVNFINGDNNSTYEVRFKIGYFDPTGGRIEWPAGATKSLVVSPGQDNWPGGFRTDLSDYSYFVHWGTTCREPTTYNYDFSNRVDGIPQYFFNINISYKNNLGYVPWTGGNNSFYAPDQSRFQNC